MEMLTVVELQKHIHYMILHSGATANIVSP